MTSIIRKLLKQAAPISPLVYTWLKSDIGKGHTKFTLLCGFSVDLSSHTDLVFVGTRWHLVMIIEILLTNFIRGMWFQRERLERFAGWRCRARLSQIIPLYFAVYSLCDITIKCSTTKKENQTIKLISFMTRQSPVITDHWTVLCCVFTWIIYLKSKLSSVTNKQKQKIWVTSGVHNSWQKEMCKEDEQIGIFKSSTMEKQQGMTFIEGVMIEQILPADYIIIIVAIWSYCLYFWHGLISFKLW